MSNRPTDERRVVLVGEHLGTIEEFIAGEGTYIEGGEIYASSSGVARFDKKNHLVKVECKLSGWLKPRSVVVGRVVDIKEKVAVVAVKKLKGLKQNVDFLCGIPISNVSEEFVNDISDALGIGDIVEAEVVRVMSGVVILSTKRGLGVVKAFCKRCRSPLLLVGRDVLRCSSCEREEKRKISENYGRGWVLT